MLLLPLEVAIKELMFLLIREKKDMASNVSIMRDRSETKLCKRHMQALDTITAM